ncbi:hypothetical protein GCM10009119_42280 [Algoriphagus jejuensis]|uniref:Uncharacterized protein n=1 Tax=Algoriphagus jejuensis TaxID=419934 RepID=A0ABP3YK92_9BACT
MFDADHPDTQKVTSNTGEAPTEERATGLEWMGPLGQLAANPTQTQALVKYLTQKNAQTGKTYLKLAVGNEAVAEDVANGIGRLFQAIDWGKLSKVLLTQMRILLIRSQRVSAPKYALDFLFLINPPRRTKSNG